MKILDKYLYKKLTVYLLVILPSFSFVAVLAELIEILRKAKQLDFYHITIYILLQLPEKIYYILPISVVIAFIMLSKDLIESKEIYPILLNGISLKKLSVKLFVFPLILSFVQLFNLEFVMPYTKKEVEKVYSVLKKKPPEETKYLFAYNQWITLDNRSFMYFKFLDVNKKEGKHILYIKFNDNFKPVFRLEGERFVIKNDSIYISKGKVIDLSNLTDFRYEHVEKFEYPIKVDINNFKKLIKVKKPISILQLYESASIAEKFGYPAGYYWSRFYSKLSTIFSPLILSIVIFPFLWSKRKDRLVIAFGSIIIYWYGTAFIASMAESGAVPYITIMSVNLVYLAVGFLYLKKLRFSEL
ncbi:LptF/LptG family permease [Persephonella sp.]